MAVSRVQAAISMLARCGGRDGNLGAAPHQHQPQQSGGRSPSTVTLAIFTPDSSFR